jgi:hypothetical protein
MVDGPEAGLLSSTVAETATRPLPPASTLLATGCWTARPHGKRRPPPGTRRGQNEPERLFLTVASGGRACRSHPRTDMEPAGALRTPAPSVGCRNDDHLGLRLVQMSKQGSRLARCGTAGLGIGKARRTAAAPHSAEESGGLPTGRSTHAEDAHRARHGRSGAVGPRLRHGSTATRHTGGRASSPTRTSAVQRRRLRRRRPGSIGSSGPVTDWSPSPRPASLARTRAALRDRRQRPDHLLVAGAHPRQAARLRSGLADPRPARQRESDRRIDPQNLTVVVIPMYNPTAPGPTPASTADPDRLNRDWRTSPSPSRSPSGAGGRRAPAWPRPHPGQAPIVETPTTEPVPDRCRSIDRRG